MSWDNVEDVRKGLKEAWEKDIKEAADFLRKHGKANSPVRLIYKGKFYDSDNLTEQDKQELKHLFP